MFGIEKKVTGAARKAALFSVSAVLGAVGAAFLTAAVWMALAELRSAVFASGIIGLAYVGLAIIAAAFAKAKMSNDRHEEDRAQSLDGLSPLQLVVVSFLQGLEQGARSKKKPE